MLSPVPDYLQTVLDASTGHDAGQLADSIAALATADPSLAGIALTSIDGVVSSVGDAAHAFSIQSISKPLVYALALADIGIEGVLAKVDVEPSGEAFNVLSLEEGTGRPENPMINAGAIAVHSLVAGGSDEERDRRILDFCSSLAGRELHVDEQVFESEWSSSHRNLGLGHLLRAFGIVTADPVMAVRGYVRQCAISVTIEDLAMMAATLAGGGVQPRTRERVLDPRLLRHVLSVMATCGMYDAAGDWMTSVGIPAKSGVSGGIMGVAPGQLGIATLSPRLDAHGTSARGVAMMERLSGDLGMHLMAPARPARSALGGVRATVLADGSGVTVYDLNGDLLFSSTEALVERIIADPPSTDAIAFDLSRVDEVSGVASMMATETARRLAADGYRVLVNDPRDLLSGSAQAGIDQSAVERMSDADGAAVRLPGGS